MSWARLLKRVFELDLEHCPNCGGELKIIAAIQERPVIDPHAPGSAGARTAANCWAWTSAAGGLTLAQTSRSNDSGVEGDGSARGFLGRGKWGLIVGANPCMSHLLCARGRVNR
jgi:hypothetical protein